MTFRILLSAFFLLFASHLPADEVQLAAAAPRTIEMEVDGLVCAFCAQGIEKKLRTQSATDDVFVSLERRLVAVALKPAQDISDDALKALLLDAGYTLKSVKRSQESLAAVRTRVKKP